MSPRTAAAERRSDTRGVPYDMLAVLFRAPNDAVVEEIPSPRKTRPRHALVRVEASMVCATDRKILEGKFPGTVFPHVPGHEFSGEVIEVGEGVSGLEPGTRVAPEVHVGCGSCDRCREGLYNLCLNYGKLSTGHAHIGFTVAGGLAEYVEVPASALHPLPDSVSYEDGAWTDNLGVALWALERGRLRAGERVAVVGSGAIGLCATQLARTMGAASVTLVGRGARLGRAHDLADATVTEAQAADLGGRFDLVVEFAGTAEAARLGLTLARRGGRVVLGGATGKGVELSGIDLSTIVRGHLDVLGSVANPMGVSGRALEMLGRGLVNVHALTTHHFPLRDFDEAWKTFTERRGGAIRVMLHPGRT